MKTVKTPAGILTINKVKIPSAYTCAAEQKIEYISENHVQIITMNQAVSFGDQILSPRICQSCMNPEKITIYPLEIEYFGEKVFFTDHYSVKEWKKGESLTLEKFDDYYRDVNLDTVIFKIMPNESAQEIAFENGELNIIRVSTIDKYEKYAANDNYEMVTLDEGRINYM